MGIFFWGLVDFQGEPFQNKKEKSVPLGSTDSKCSLRCSEINPQRIPAEEKDPPERALRPEVLSLDRLGGRQSLDTLPPVFQWSLGHFD